MFTLETHESPSENVSTSPTGSSGTDAQRTPIKIASTSIHTLVKVIPYAKKHNLQRGYNKRKEKVILGLTESFGSKRTFWGDGEVWSASIFKEHFFPILS